MSARAWIETGLISAVLSRVLLAATLTADNSSALQTGGTATRDTTTAPAQSPKEAEKQCAETSDFLAIRKEAEAGDAKAQYLLGLAYSKGEGIPKDDVEAAQWVRKAAAQGSADASDRTAELITETNPWQES